MVLRLKNRRKPPPNGFLYEQVQTGWRNWIAAPTTVWDFFQLCQAIQQHRQANPRLGLTTNLLAIQEEVDIVNATRVFSIPGARDEYIQMPSTAVPPPNPPAPPRNSLLDVVGAKLSKMASGMGVIYDWLGADGEAVSPAVAETRARVCVACPQNAEPRPLEAIFVKPAAEQLRRMLEAKNKMELKTSLDSQLGHCRACLCVNSLKVWVPMEHVKAHLNEDIKKDLDPRCWILNEG